MSERTRRPPGDGASETLAGRERDSSPDARSSETAQRVSTIPASHRVMAQAETAERMHNSSRISAQRKTRHAMDNSAGLAPLRKAAQGMQDTTASRLALPQADPMAGTMMEGVAGLPTGLQVAASVSGPDQDSGPPVSTVSVPVQRALKVKGNPAASRTALLDLLGESAGLKLVRAADTKLVTIAEEVKGAPQSPALRAALKTIINDGAKTAQVSVQPGEEIFIGSFRDWQEVDVPALVKLEEQEAGAGASMAIHEIWENYSAQGAGKDGGFGKYKPAHDAATRVESTVAAEMSGLSSDRVADSSNGKYAAFDYRFYYLVIEQDDKTVVRVSRTEMGRQRLQNYADGAAAYGEGDGARVADARALLATQRLATVQVLGYRKATEDAGLARQRAAAVLAELNVADRGFVVDGGIAAEGGVTIIVTRPEGEFPAAAGGGGEPASDSDDDEPAESAAK